MNDDDVFLIRIDLTNKETVDRWTKILYSLSSVETTPLERTAHSNLIVPLLNAITSESLPPASEILLTSKQYNQLLQMKAQLKNKK